MPWDPRRNMQLAMRRKSSGGTVPAKKAPKRATVDDVNSVGRNYNRKRSAPKIGTAVKITRKGGRTKTKVRK